jgi:multiple antibiotic resistance protein
MNARLFGEVFVTVLFIIDPPGNVPIFLSVTRLLSPKERHRAALVATATAFLVIALFAVGGRQILEYLGVTVPALRGAGGLLLLLVSLELLSGREGAAVEEMTPEQRTSIAMVPLGTPLLAGPGAIVATIVFVGRSSAPRDLVAIGLGLMATMVVTYLALRFSDLIMRLIRPTGVLLVSRVAGMLVAAIAVQMIADAVRDFVQAAT